MKNIAIVTGATGGLGSRFSFGLVDEVDEIWIVGRNVKKLEDLSKKLSDKARCFQVDLSNVDNLKTIEDELKCNEYQVKYLVNNAGTGRMAPSTDFSVEEISSHITTHNTSMVVLCNICIPYMTKGCHILNIASQSAFQPVAYINLYAASKAFCYSYTRALNMELRDKGIVATVVCPGWVRTELLQTEMNGHVVEFPHLADAEDVVALAIKDAKKGKDISVYSAYVKFMQLLAKLYPHKWVMKTWVRSVKKYIE